jgi:cyclic pyranopterin phosphate synthase
MSLSHFDAQGQAHMVDVSAKPDTTREAVAEGLVLMSAETLALAGGAAKGDVMGVARLAGIMGAKRTSDLIPLCHPLPIAKVRSIWADPSLPGIRVTATVRTTGKTGVEMEALTAVSTACLTIYDMLKAAQRTCGSKGSAFCPRPAANPARSTPPLKGPAMISVDDARKLVLALARPAGTEEIALDQGLGRTLATPAVAGLTQPPFNASAMDGYALRSAELPGPLQVIGAAAGVPMRAERPRQRHPHLYRRPGARWL